MKKTEDAQCARRPAVPRVVALIEKSAQCLGWQVRSLDPEYGHLFELSDGRRTVTLLGGRSPLNDAVAARITEDKYYTGLLLARAGFRVPESVRCLKPGHFELEDYADRVGKEPGHEFARAHGYPVVVKPNRLSHGRFVFLVYDRGELNAAIDTVWRHDYIALVQTPIPGIDLRLDFLGGEYLTGYLRRPSPSEAPPSPDDEPVQILNLAQGALAELFEEPGEDWTDFGLRVGGALNLRYFGIDLKIPSKKATPDQATVIEVNASPLLVQIHKLGFEQQAVNAQARVLRAVMDRCA